MRCAGRPCRCGNPYIRDVSLAWCSFYPLLAFVLPYGSTFWNLCSEPRPNLRVPKTPCGGCTLYSSLVAGMGLAASKFGERAPYLVCATAVSSKHIWTTIQKSGMPSLDGMPFGGHRRHNQGCCAAVRGGVFQADKISSLKAFAEREVVLGKRAVYIVCTCVHRRQTQPLTLGARLEDSGGAHCTTWVVKCIFLCSDECPHHSLCLVGPVSRLRP